MAAYESAHIEARWYQYWQDHGFFQAKVNPAKPPHVIMMPPPNVTGRLHMGHALQGTVQDILTRMRRMQGYEALWMPGIDHAGIATQNVVERMLKKETGQDRHALGREAFVDKVWEWKEEYGAIIIDQYKRLGTSCDWDRMRFTMDDGFTRAVQSVFVKLYEDGLIYRGNYLVNWCPVDMTAISDEEVDNVERDGSLWHVRYPIVPEEEGTGPSKADEHAFITVATTRPETILGDTALAVHPEDERYQHLIGRRVRVPLIGREVPIIADSYVKMDFGAGALKVTPAHDTNDFEIGRRHNLETVNVLNFDATLNENAGAYEGLDRFDARKKIVEDLDTAGLLVKIEPYKNTVPISSRSKAIIEPLISRQWFVKMKPLAEPALKAVREGEVTFHPRRWENEYFRWLDNIRDWTISRQLWWGHRIPVWYYTAEDGEIDETRDFVVSVEQPEAGMVQDEDVLDTWFSSWLWPFATLGWPDETPDLRYFHPGNVLVSGYDILFFWIARMIMAGYYCMDEKPYGDIFITGMIKDKQGRWMSKSLGNGIDPLDMIEQYGADAVRYSLTILCAQGQDIKLDPLKFEMGRNFANKIWNAFNVFGQFMGGGKTYERTRSFEDLELVEQWMVHRLNETIAHVDEAASRYRLNEALAHIYDVFWRDYCDWYLELIKPAPGETMSDETIALAVELYERMIQLLHPFMPYITEELWWKLRSRGEGEACIVSAWPVRNDAETSADAAETFALIQQMTTAVRNVKNQYGVPAKHVDATLNIAAGFDSLADTIRAHASYFEQLARASVTVGTRLSKPAASAVEVVDRHEVFVPLAGMVDLEVERERLRKEITQKEGFLASVQRKLSNEQFVSRAPAAVVDRERKKAEDARAELAKLNENLMAL